MNAIEMKNLTKSYNDFKLDDLTLILPSGCIMGLIGENGAGKSTTIKLILNMIQKDSGQIIVLGDERIAFKRFLYDVEILSCVDCYDNCFFSSVYFRKGQ